MAMGYTMRGKDFIRAMIGPLGLEGRSIKALSIRADVNGLVEVDVTEVVRELDGRELAAQLSQICRSAVDRARSGGES